MAQGQALLYQEQFQVKDINKKFDKVARLHCRLAEEGYDMTLDLDVNSDLTNLDLNDKFTFALASTLSPDGTPGSEYYDQSKGPSLMDQYEYVMYGKIYKWKQDEPKKPIEVSRSPVSVCSTRHPPRAHPAPVRTPPASLASQVQVSFGGLLMRLKGDQRHLQNLMLDSRVYLLIRKITQAR